MFRALLAKDFARARRNPLPWLINLLVPIMVVAIIGMAFGGAVNKERMLGRVRFAVVDEDNTIVSRFLRGGLNQDKAARQLEPVLMERTPALAELKDNTLSAVVVIPPGFTEDFLANRPVTFELIKNPAESIKPTLLEEGLGAVATVLEALGRNFAPDLAELRSALDGKLDRQARSAVFKRWIDRIEELAPLVEAPLIGYTKPEPAKSNGAGEAKPDGGFNLFGHLLLGMAAMFLLFIGSVGMGDLHREIELRTLARFQTLHVSLLPFIGAKVVFAGLMLLLCSAILFGGGALAFGVSWHHPMELAVLATAYALCVTGLMAVLVAWIPDQRRADAVRSMVAMLLGMAGGCAFPVEQMPEAFRRFVMPLLPTHWFVSTARLLEYGGGGLWWPAAMKLAFVGFALLALSAAVFRRRFAKGGRA